MIVFVWLGVGKRSSGKGEVAFDAHIWSLVPMSGPVGPVRARPNVLLPRLTNFELYHRSNRVLFVSSGSIRPGTFEDLS